VLFEANAAEAREMPSKSEVVFKRYGDGYVLKDIWVSGSQTGAETTTVESEKHAAKRHQLDGEERVAAVKKSDGPGNR
jgi:hypothetical protein